MSFTREGQPELIISSRKRRTICGGIHQRSTLIGNKCTVLAHQVINIVPCGTVYYLFNNLHFSLNTRPLSVSNIILRLYEVEDYIHQHAMKEEQPWAMKTRWPPVTIGSRLRGKTGCSFCQIHEAESDFCYTQGKQHLKAIAWKWYSFKQNRASNCIVCYHCVNAFCCSPIWELFYGLYYCVSISCMLFSCTHNMAILYICMKNG